jgi:hypothetical protein
MLGSSAAPRGRRDVRREAPGYDYGQGYRYSPALPAEECRRWIVGFNAAAPADQLDQQLAASG